MPRALGYRKREDGKNRPSLGAPCNTAPYMILLETFRKETCLLVPGLGYLELFHKINDLGWPLSLLRQARKYQVSVP